MSMVYFTIGLINRSGSSNRLQLIDCPDSRCPQFRWQPPFGFPSQPSGQILFQLYRETYLSGALDIGQFGNTYIEKMAVFWQNKMGNLAPKSTGIFVLQATR
jgi:hypothetical protein